jgi:hypothetical protein
MSFWRVIRTQGKGGRWTLVFAGDPDRARAMYAGMLAELKVGGLALIDDRGNGVEKAWAPRLRRSAA